MFFVEPLHCCSVQTCPRITRRRNQGKLCRHYLSDESFRSHMINFIVGCLLSICMKAFLCFFFWVGGGGVIAGVTGKNSYGGWFQEFRKVKRLAKLKYHEAKSSKYLKNRRLRYQAEASPSISCSILRIASKKQSRERNHLLTNLLL